MSAFGGKADIGDWPARHSAIASLCRLLPICFRIQPRGLQRLWAQLGIASKNNLLDGGARSLNRTRLSTPEFPANREINRELRRIRLLSSILKADTRANSEACSEIPYLAKQGIFATEQGICPREQGI